MIHKLTGLQSRIALVALITLTALSGYQSLAISSEQAGNLTVNLTSKALAFDIDYSKLHAKRVSNLDHNCGIKNLERIAAAYMRDIFNPDELKLIVFRQNKKFVVFTFELQNKSKVEVTVDKITAKPLMADPLMEAALLKTRATTAANMGVDIKEARVNGVNRYDTVRKPQTGDPLYGIKLRVGAFALVVDYAIGKNQESVFILRSLVNTKMGADLLQVASKYLAETLNPDSFKLDYWGVGDGVIAFVFKLPDGFLVKIHVDKVTGVPSIADENLLNAVLSAKNNIAGSMGIDASEVHINGIVQLWNSWVLNNGPLVKTTQDTLCYGCGSYGPNYQITARVDHYTLTIDYQQSYGWYWYDVALGMPSTIDPNGQLIGSIWMPPYYDFPTTTLTSFIDNHTGHDLLKEAKTKLSDLFNPEWSNIGADSWSVVDGVLKLNMSLNHSSYPYLRFLGSNIPIDVNLKTGEITVDPVITDMVTKARRETSEKLGLQMSDVHVNSFWGNYIYRIYEDGINFVRPLYSLSVSTPRFNLSYSYDRAGKLTLTSLVNKQTGQDLLQNAMSYLIKVVNPDSLNLDSWCLRDGVVIFSFKLQNGTIINIDVDVTTGGTNMEDQQLIGAVLKMREELAAKMGVDISEVHVNDVDQYSHLTNFRDSPQYQITTRVGNYTLVLDYHNYGWGIYPIDDPMPQAITLGDEIARLPRPYPYWGWTTTLRAFVDNRTGVDYVKEAQGKVLDLLNPEYNNIHVSYWYMENGVLKLNVDLYPFINPFLYLAQRIGGTILVDVNLGTGEVKIDSKIVDAVMKARNETSQKLNIALGDVHVNDIFQFWVGSVIFDGPVSPGGYIINVSTPQFNLTYKYNFSDGSLKLESLVSRETGQDLYKNAADGIKNILNPDQFTLSSWSMNDGEVTFDFKLGDNSIIRVKISASTGEMQMFNSNGDLIAKSASKREIKQAKAILGENIAAGITQLPSPYCADCSTTTSFYNEAGVLIGQHVVGGFYPQDAWFISDGNGGWIPVEPINISLPTTEAKLVKNEENTKIDPELLQKKAMEEKIQSQRDHRFQPTMADKKGSLLVADK